MANRIGLLIITMCLVLSGYSQKIHLKKEANGYWVMENNEKVFFFQRNLNDSISEYSRNNYFHPVYDLNGNCITEDYPSDHLHHRGIFWAWHQVLVDGKQICDAWDIKNFSQNVSQFEFTRDTKMNGIVKYTSFWHTNDKPDDAFLMENTKVIVYPKTKNYRRIDFTISLRALEKNLSIGGADNEKGYGGFTVRMKTNNKTVFTDSKNKKITPTNLSLPAGQYIDISNSENKSGVTIISWLQNPGEEQWILRQTGSAQNCSWPGREPVSLSVTQPTILRYTLLIHRGKRKQVPIDAILKSIQQTKNP